MTEFGLVATFLKQRECSFVFGKFFHMLYGCELGFAQAQTRKKSSNGKTKKEVLKISFFDMTSFVLANRHRFAAWHALGVI